MAITRRSSFFLHTTHHNATSSSLIPKQDHNQASIWRCGGTGRSGKQRPDERLRTQWKLETIRRCDDGGSSGARNLQLQKMIHGVQSVGRGGGSSNSKKFSWGKMMRWRTVDQRECSIACRGSRSARPWCTYPVRPDSTRGAWFHSSRLMLMVPVAE